MREPVRDVRRGSLPLIERNHIVVQLARSPVGTTNRHKNEQRLRSLGFSRRRRQLILPDRLEVWGNVRSLYAAGLVRILQVPLPEDIEFEPKWLSDFKIRLLGSNIGGRRSHDLPSVDDALSRRRMFIKRTIAEVISHQDFVLSLDDLRSLLDSVTSLVVMEIASRGWSDQDWMSRLARSLIHNLQFDDDGRRDLIADLMMALLRPAEWAHAYWRSEPPSEQSRISALQEICSVGTITSILVANVEPVGSRQRLRVALEREVRIRNESVPLAAEWRAVRGYVVPSGKDVSFRPTRPQLLSLQSDDIRGECFFDLYPEKAGLLNVSIDFVDERGLSGRTMVHLEVAPTDVQHPRELQPLA